MPEETLTVSGRLTVVLRDANGDVKKSQTHKNLVVNTGLEFMASRMLGASKNVMSHMAVGSGTTAAAAGDTALETALGPRKALSSSAVNGGDAKKVEFEAVFNAGEGTGAVTEAGIFNAGSGGDMLCRTVFPVINKTSSDSLSIVWTITAGV